MAHKIADDNLDIILAFAGHVDARAVAKRFRTDIPISKAWSLRNTDLDDIVRIVQKHRAMPCSVRVIACDDPAHSERATVFPWSSDGVVVLSTCTRQLAQVGERMHYLDFAFDIAVVLPDGGRVRPDISFGFSHFYDCAGVLLRAEYMPCMLEKIEGAVAFEYKHLQVYFDSQQEFEFQRIKRKLHADPRHELAKRTGGLFMPCSSMLDGQAVGQVPIGMATSMRDLYTKVGPTWRERMSSEKTPAEDLQVWLDGLAAKYPTELQPYTKKPVFVPHRSYIEYINALEARCNSVPRDVSAIEALLKCKFRHDGDRRHLVALVRAAIECDDHRKELTQLALAQMRRSGVEAGDLLDDEHAALFQTYCLL